MNKTCAACQLGCLLTIDWGMLPIDGFSTGKRVHPYAQLGSSNVTPTGMNFSLWILSSIKWWEGACAQSISPFPGHVRTFLVMNYKYFLPLAPPMPLLRQDGWKAPKGRTEGRVGWCWVFFFQIRFRWDVDSPSLVFRFVCRPPSPALLGTPVSRCCYHVRIYTYVFEVFCVRFQSMLAICRFGC